LLAFNAEINGIATGEEEATTTFNLLQS